VRATFDTNAANGESRIAQRSSSPILVKIVLSESFMTKRMPDGRIVQTMTASIRQQLTSSVWRRMGFGWLAEALGASRMIEPGSAHE
jgi:hypothetical protein